jgi:diguanylate cyclase (GGDEF) domain
MSPIGIGFAIALLALGVTGGAVLVAVFGRRAGRAPSVAADPVLWGRRDLSEAQRRALEALGAGIVVSGERGARGNARARALLGLEPEEGVRDGAGDYRLLASLRERPELAALLVSGEGGAELSLGSGEARRVLEARAFPFDPGEGLPETVLILTDVTERALLLEELSDLASRDALTDVYNRRRFSELCERDFELAKRSLTSLGLIMLDIDLFKRVNDEHGHDSGDKVLKAVCAACDDALRSTDVFCRYGGEEFAVFLPGSGPGESLAVAERLRDRIARLSVACASGGICCVTVSLGVFAGVPAKDESLALYLRRADEALYRSKALGRNRATYWKPIDQQASRSHA